MKKNNRTYLKEDNFMKKNILKVTLVVAIAIVCGTSFLNSQKSETLSDIALANVEALADKNYTIVHSWADGSVYI